MIYDGRREGADPCFAGENTLIPMTHIHRYPQVLRHSSLSQTNFDLTAAPECVRLSRSVWFNLRCHSTLCLHCQSARCPDGAPHDPPMDKKERSREHFAPQHRAESLLSPSPPLVAAPEQQLFGFAGLKIGGQADFKRPICG